MTKAQIRSIQKELRNKLTPEDHLSLDNAISSRLFQMPEFKQCKNLLTFVSFGAEVDTHEIIHKSLEAGKLVYVPRVEGQNMEFYHINDLKSLNPSKFGVPEPPKAVTNSFLYHNENKNPIITETAEHQTLNLMLLPGLAFDQCGNRIGYGAGYYDRYLTENSSIPFYKVALAYDFQVMEHIPAESFDIKADVILTPTQMIICNKAS